MNVLVLGGTGNIGSAIVQALIARGARTGTLCRNARRAERAEALSSTPLIGDIRTPEVWIGEVAQYDAVIHAACTFDQEMGEVDTRLTAALLEALPAGRARKKLVYTAGAWCYGNTSSEGADESSPFDPIPEFSWGVDNSRAVLRSTSVSGMTIHPSNVVDKYKLGVPPVLLRESQGKDILRVPATPESRWPLVEREDLAELYCLVLDKGEAGQDYMGTSETGVPVRKMVDRVVRHRGIATVVYEPAEYWMNKYGSWARGYMLDQVVHSRKAERELGWAPVFRFDA
jgi:nucleoside-diphosphate-sugar epimerase